MVTPLLMPKLGRAMESGQVGKWLKKEGQPIREGDHLVSVETDQLTHKVLAPTAGVLLKILARPGEELKVKFPMAIIGQPGEDLSAWVGEQAPNQSPLSKPANSTSFAPKKNAASPPSTPPPVQPPSPTLSADDELFITPRAKKLMKEHDLQLSDVRPLGKSRINEIDVQALLDQRYSLQQQQQQQLQHQQSQAVSSVPVIPTSPNELLGLTGKVIPLTNQQRITAVRTIESLRDIPQFSLHFEVDMTHALSIRQTRGIQAHMKFTLTDVLLRAVALAVPRCPAIVRRFTSQGLLEADGVHIGLAVATPQGLVVPVLRDAHHKKLPQLATDAKTLARKAHQGNLTNDEITGSVLTVSNLGMLGITRFTPMVNPGESVTLGVGTVNPQYRLRNDAPTWLPILEMTLVCDHRAIDGAIAADFSRVLTKVLETEPSASW